jgi:Porin subfamily
MNLMKSVILGSATSLLVAGGAGAADLPVKAKAVEYVRICSLYGAGFFYIPGADTCIKLGGYLRVDLNYNAGVSDAPFWNGEGAIRDRYANWYNDLARMALTVDTRTATEYGVVRTFGQVDLNFATYGAGNSIGYAGSLFPVASAGQLNNLTAGNGYVGVEYLLMQFAGFTFGKSASAYNTPWHGFLGNNTAYLVGGYDTVSGIVNAQYTAQFGNGVSLTVGVDDSSANQYNRTQIINAIGGAPALANLALPGVPGTFAGAQGGQITFIGGCAPYYTPFGCAYGGAAVPDFVGNVRVDQAWGLFQISGAIHDNHAGYFQGANVNTSVDALTGFNQAGFINFGHPGDAFGGAVEASLQIKNIPTGSGDDIKVDGSWSLGASKYVLGTAAPLPSSFNILNGSRYAMGIVTDAIYSGQSPGNCTAAVAGGLGCNGNPLTQLQLTRGWGFRGAFNHNWDAYWSTSLFGGIAGLSYNQTAKTLYCNTYVANAGVAIAGGGVTHGGGTGAIFTPGSVCDPGFTISEIGIVTRWTPVKNLTFSAEAMYTFLKTNMSGGAVPVSAATGGATGPSTALVLPTTVYNFGSNGNASLNVRVQRNF